MVYNHGQRLSPSFTRNMLSVIVRIVPPSPVIITASTFAGHGSHMLLGCNFHCRSSDFLNYRTPPDAPPTPDIPADISAVLFSLTDDFSCG